MNLDLPPTWKQKLSPVFKETFFKELGRFLEFEEKAGKLIYPESNHVFRAFQAVDLPQVKVVILGQDPYHDEGQAIGLSFAVPNSLKRKPPSLRNIFKELESDLHLKLPESESDLTAWASQGVFLLNTVLTVEAHQALSHRDQGWEQFTDQVIFHLNARQEPIVFILWGAFAQKLKPKIDLNRHAVLESSHPSPLSSYRGFFGSRVFSKTNEQLIKFGKSPIDWQKISNS